MAFKTLWVLIPKWLLAGLVACFFAYYTGVSHGRAPYELAEQVTKSLAKPITKQSKKVDELIEIKRKSAHENLKNNDYVFDDDNSNKLSDILRG